MDLTSGIKRIIATGKIEYGTNSTLDHIRSGKAKAVIIAENTPESFKSDIEQYSRIAGVPMLVFRGTSLELGQVCGKPFVIRSIAILNMGDVKIKELLEEQ